MKLENHPTVKRYRERRQETDRRPASPIDADRLRKLCLEAGADDAGVTTLDAPALEGEGEEMLAVFPAARSVIGLVCRLNPEALRCASRSTADLEFLYGMKRLDEAGAKVLAALRREGVRGLRPATAFPMDQEKWPGRTWTVAHKLVAEATGMGRRGHHRLLIHPRFGSFVVVGTILIDAEVSSYGEPLDFNPCIECKLCAAVCPVGAVAKDGHFAFITCLVHNYRDRLQGFIDWVEQVAESGGARAYRKRVNDAETVSIWQALTYGISNKCSYCMAACPTGEEVIGPYLDDRKGYHKKVIKPLRDRKERIYVLPRSDAEAHVTRRFPAKKIKRVGSGIRSSTVSGFFEALPLAFNRDRAADLKATYHFTFTGDESLCATVVIEERTLAVHADHVGHADVRVKADSATWLAFLAKEQGILPAMLTGKIRVKGSPRLLKRFAECFPL